MSCSNTYFLCFKYYKTVIKIKRQFRRNFRSFFSFVLINENGSTTTTITGLGSTLHWNTFEVAFESVISNKKIKSSLDLEVYLTLFIRHFQRAHWCNSSWSKCLRDKNCTLSLKHPGFLWLYWGEEIQMQHQKLFELFMSSSSPAAAGIKKKEKKRNSILFTKLFWPTVRKKSS